MTLVAGLAGCYTNNRIDNDFIKSAGDTYEGIP